MVSEIAFSFPFFHRNMPHRKPHGHPARKLPIKADKLVCIGKLVYIKKKDFENKKIIVGMKAYY